MCNIQEDLFFESHVIAHRESDLSLFDAVAQYCTENDIPLHGVVFADNDMGLQLIHDASVSLHSQECMSEETSVVIASNIEMLNHSQDKTAYCEKRAELEKVIAQIQEDVNSDAFRVNAVLYDEMKMSPMQITGGGQEWIEKFLQEGCPSEMKRPLFVGRALVYLLSGDSQYTTGTLVSVNR